jgi:hypothetical protein
MSTTLTGIYTPPPAVYAGPMPNPPDDGRVVIQARVLRASAARLDEIAKTHPGWSRSDALRHLLALGLAAYDSHDRRAEIAARRRPIPAHGPAQIDADLHAKLQKGHRA